MSIHVENIGPFKTRSETQIATLNTARRIAQSFLDTQATYNKIAEIAVTTPVVVDPTPFAAALDPLAAPYNMGDPDIR